MWFVVYISFGEKKKYETIFNQIRNFLLMYNINLIKKCHTQFIIFFYRNKINFNYNLKLILEKILEKTL